MKTLFLTIFALLILSVNAQKQNENGLFINSDGTLYTGVYSQTKDAVKSDLDILDGVVTGKATYYYASGNKMESGFMLTGLKDGKWMRYSENGKTLAIGFYNQGKKDGEWTIFDEMGVKRMVMFYNNGQKSGTWNSWDESGKLANSISYGGAN